MALTLSELGRGHLGPLKAVLTKATFDSTYPAGGESLVATDIGLDQIVAVFANTALDEGGTVANACAYDHSTKKLLLFETGDTVSTDLDEQNTADQSAKSCHLLIVGH